MDSATLGAFTDAVGALAASVPSGSWPFFDGYRLAPAASTVAARAYRAAILLRELRFGVHTEAVKAAGLSPVTANAALDGNRPNRPLALLCVRSPDQHSCPQ